LTTTAITAITYTSANSGGSFSNAGSSVFSYGVCWSTSANPTVVDSHTTDGTGNSGFTSNVTGLTPGTMYYVRAYATNGSNTIYGNEQTFTTNLSKKPPVITTTGITSITYNSGISGGTITDSGGAAVTARGVCWNLSSSLSSPTIADSHTTDSVGIGTFISNITGLSSFTTYNFRAYATNSFGTTYGSQNYFTTISAPCSFGYTLVITHNAGTVAPVTKTVTYNTVQSTVSGASKCWITQNLGADHSASSPSDATEASAGWYWQFNRLQGYKHDGTTSTPNFNTTTDIYENSDWTSANDPCTSLLGAGWRIPTKTEYTNAMYTGVWYSSSYNYTDAYNSELKIHAAGYIKFVDGSLNSRGSTGYYYSSSQNGSANGFFLQYTIQSGYIPADVVGVNYNYKHLGLALRCLQD